MKDKVTEALECVAHWNTGRENLDHSHKPCLHFPDCDHSPTLAQEVRRLRAAEESGQYALDRIVSECAGNDGVNEGQRLVRIARLATVALSRQSEGAGK